MSCILGLDISTTIVGFCFLDAKTGKLLECSFIDLRKVDGLILKLDFFMEKFADVLAAHPDVCYIGAEAALEMFSGGGSTAHTIGILKAFNFGLTYQLHKVLKLDPCLVSFAEARKLANIKLPRWPKGTPPAKKKSEKKETIRAYCASKYPEIVWDVNKNGNIQPYCWDMADSILIAEFLHNMYINQVPISYM